MSYALNQLIRIGDYNSFAGANGTASYGAEPATASLAGGGSLGIMYGPGYGSYGYNQSDISLSAVVANTLIRTGEWTHLRNVLANIRVHQTGSTDAAIPPGSLMVANHLIDAHESSVPTSDPYDFNSVIDLALANRFVMSSGTQFALNTMTRSSSWGAGVGAVQGVMRCAWASADAAGWFFNTGGYIQFDLTQPVTTTQDNDWHDALVNRVGSIRIRAKSSTNTGSVPISTTNGFYNLTGSYQTLWLGTGTNGFINAHYAINTVKIEALVGGAAAHGRPGTQIDFRITLTDSHTGGSDLVSLGTAVSTTAVKDTTNLSTVPATPTGSIQSNW